MELLHGCQKDFLHDVIRIIRSDPGHGDPNAAAVLVRASRDGDRSAFGGWLAAIARNSANGHHRAAVAVEELPELSHEATQEDEREAGHVLATIRTLPEAYRETLMMRLVEGMTGPEIAERTGLTPGSVRVNLHRGMELLRQALEGRRA